eukprot:97703_1
MKNLYISVILLLTTHAAFANVPKSSPTPRSKLTEIAPFCDSDNYMQSPINIDTSLTIKGSPVCAVANELDWNLLHDTVDVLVENTWQELIITPIVHDESLTNRDGAVKLNQERDQIAELSNYYNINNMIEQHHDYCFDSVRFHWGRNGDVGSEHTVNGKQYPLELHFVHFSCDFDNLKEAMRQWVTLGNEGKDIYVVGIVAVMFKVGEANAAIQKILDHYQRLTEKGQSVIVKDVALNLLTPEHLGYFSYDGGFTVPPCTPCVRWHVLTHPVDVSEQQLNELRTLLRPTPSDQRNKPPLESNPNPVYECTHGGPHVEV